MKTGVKRVCNYDPELNKTYLELSEHYGCTIIPARSRKPKEKSPVVGKVGDACTQIAAALRHQKFLTFHQLNLAIWEKLREFSQKTYQKKTASGKVHFLNLYDQAFKPLPYKAYEMTTWKVAIVSLVNYVGYYSIFIFVRNFKCFLS